MKKLFVVSVIALFFGINAQAFEVKPYVAGKINFNIEKYDIGDGIDFDDEVFGGGFAVGIAGDKTVPIRIEFEYNLLSKAKDSFLDAIDVSSKLNSYMLNFYYDFYNESNFIPYINFGLDATTAKLTIKVIFIMKKMANIYTSKKTKVEKKQSLLGKLVQAHIIK